MPHLSRPTPQEFISLAKVAWPLVLAQLAQNSLSFIDTMMVGRLGKESLAGIAIGGTVFFLVVFVLSGMILAVGPMVSHAVGANKPADAAKAAQQGLWLALCMTPIALMTFWFIEPILIWTGQPPETVELSTGYLQAISWGLLPAFGLFALRGFLEGMSDTGPIMLICFLGVGLNVVANQALMFGQFGLPALGLVGTGYASSIVFAAMFCMMAGYIRWKHRSFEVVSLRQGPNLKTIGEIIRIGTPIGLTIGFEISVFSLMAVLIGRFGKDPLAAHQIAMQSASVAFMVPLGIGLATAIRVGNAIGRGSKTDAAKAGYTGMLMAFLFTCFSAVVFWFFPDYVLRLYFETQGPENEEVTKIAISFLKIAGIFQLADGLQVLASCSLRGLKDTRAAMILSLISYWLVGITACLVLCYTFELGPQGLWYGVVVALAAAAVSMTARFVQQVR